MDKKRCLIAAEIKLAITAMESAGFSHIGGSILIYDAWQCLREVMNIDPRNPAYRYCGCVMYGLFSPLVRKQQQPASTEQVCRQFDIETKFEAFGLLPQRLTGTT